MTCTNYNNLYDILVNFDNLFDVVRCPFTSDMGAGLGVPVFGLLFFGMIGIALTIRTQHPGPVVVAGILTAGLVTASLPGQGAQVLAVILFLSIAAMGFYLYQRAKRSL